MLLLIALLVAPGMGQDSTQAWLKNHPCSPVTFYQEWLDKGMGEENCFNMMLMISKANAKWVRIPRELVKVSFHNCVGCSCGGVGWGVYKIETCFTEDMNLEKLTSEIESVRMTSWQKSPNLVECFETFPANELPDDELLLSALECVGVSSGYSNAEWTCFADDCSPHTLASAGSWFGSETDARNLCQKCDGCTALHDFGADGRNWRACSSVKNGGSDKGAAAIHCSKKLMFMHKAEAGASTMEVVVRSFAGVGLAATLFGAFRFYTSK